MENQLPKRLQKHVVICPHCGAQMLDHMTECKKCGGELTPKGYSPMMSDDTRKKIRIIVWIVLSVLAILIILWRITAKSDGKVSESSEEDNVTGLLVTYSEGHTDAD